ncbi:MAG: 6-carboxytetrahydropterin synthase [Acidobacteriota bacterium]
MSASSTSPSRPEYVLRLAKEDFKFSAAHFTLFGADEAELLHGHNYHVEVEMVGHELDEEGLLVSFVDAKKAIRAACARLDDQTLIPTRSRHLRITRADGEVEVRFGARRYVLPEEDTLLLAEVNTTVELFARMIWEDIVRDLDCRALVALAVSVAETAGQACWYRAPIR